MKNVIEEIKGVNAEKGMAERERKAIQKLASFSYEAIKEDIVGNGSGHLLGDYLSILDTLNQAGKNRAGHFILILLDRCDYCEFIPMIEILCEPESEGLDVFVNHFMSTMYLDLTEDDEDEDDDDDFDIDSCMRMEDDFDCDGECEECPFYKDNYHDNEEEPCHPQVRITAEAEGCSELIAMMKEIISDLGITPVKTEESVGGKNE